MGHAHSGHLDAALSQHGTRTIVVALAGYPPVSRFAMSSDPPAPSEGLLGAVKARWARVKVFGDTGKLVGQGHYSDGTATVPINTPVELVVHRY